MVKGKRQRKSDLASTILLVGVIVEGVLVISSISARMGIWNVVSVSALLVVAILWRILEAVESRTPKE